MKHDAIYARYSSHAQDDGTSIEVQIEQCERAAGGKCKHYIDRAKTGRAMGGRTQLLALLADADAGKIARVFVYKFDRLGRAADTHVVAQQLEDSGVQLISATEGTNQLSRGIQLVVAEDYSRQLANRGDAERIRAEIKELDARQTRSYELLLDRSISEGTKQAINRQMTEAEAERAHLQSALDGLLNDANDNTDALVNTIRDLFDTAKENLAAAGTPEAYNRFIEQVVGPIELVDGNPTQKELPPAETVGSDAESRLARPVAGACSDPVHMLIGGGFRQRIIAA
jgi:DNA invertase Pin-like site-specific DNA recombinase